MKPPVPTKQATVRLIKVKSRNALLRMVLLSVGGYLKSVLRYKFLILNTYHPDTGWDTSIGIATRYGLDGPGIKSQ
jgi:hypothetical protein